MQKLEKVVILFERKEHRNMDIGGPYSIIVIRTDDLNWNIKLTNEAAEEFLNFKNLGTVFV